VVNVTKEFKKIMIPANALSRNNGGYNVIPFEHKQFTSFTISSVDRQMIFANGDSTISMLDTSNNSWITITGNPQDVLYSFAVGKNDLLVAVNSAKIVALFGKTMGDCKGVYEHNGSEIEALVAIDDRMWVWGHRDGAMTVFNLNQEKGWCLPKRHTDSVTALLSVDGVTVMSGSADKTIKCWDLRSDTCFQTLAGHTGAVLSLVMPDAKTMISASSDSTIRVWDWKKGDCLRTLISHDDAVPMISLYDAETLLSASLDKTVKIWNWKTGVCQWLSARQQSQVLGVAKMDDGRLFVHIKGQPQIWDFTQPESTQSLISGLNPRDNIYLGWM
jgi:WD40 repeat protein